MFSHVPASHPFRRRCVKKGRKVEVEGALWACGRTLLSYRIALNPKYIVHICAGLQDL